MLFLLMLAMSVSVDGQNNYWTRKVKILEPKTKQQEKSTGDLPRNEKVLSPVQVPSSVKSVSVMESSSTASSQQVGVGLTMDSLSIFFRFDSIRIEMDYAGNAKAWDTFVSKLHNRYSDVPPNALRLDIYSGASPEGSASHNRWLGENRGIAIRRLVRQRLGNRVGGIIIHNEAARWDGLYEAVARSQEPWRDAVLDIIEQPASSDENKPDKREQKLRALLDGTVWPVLLERYMAPLRSGSTAILSWVGHSARRDTIVVRDTIVMANAMFNSSMLPSAIKAKELKPVWRQPVWILRSNIPLLLTGTPNLQAEWSIGHKDRWSVNVEGVWSWWTFSHNAYANEIMYGSVELRRWIGQRWRHHTLDGWHIGLAGGIGYGDLEWYSRGYQGEVYSGFVNVGWQHRFGHRKQWAFDAGVGVGYAYIPYRRYEGSTRFPVGKEEYYDDHLMWQDTRSTHWVGPVHANISLGYVFNQRDAAYKRHKAMDRDTERNDYLHFRDSLKVRQAFERDSIGTSKKFHKKEMTFKDHVSRNQMTEKQKAKWQRRYERMKRRTDEEHRRNQNKLEREMDRVDNKYKRQQ